MDITPLLSQNLAKTSSTPLKAHPFDLGALNAFLQEAYRINAHITDLTKYLRSIRAPYLALGSHRPTTNHSNRTNKLNGSATTPTSKDASMNDTDRKRIETETKQLLSTLSSAVRELSAAAAADAEARSLIADKARSKRGLGALGRWAAGGGVVAKTPEEIDEDAKQETVRIHRDGVLWFLQKRLEAVSEMQWEMVAVRLQRAVERNKSVLYKAGLDTAGIGTGRTAAPAIGGYGGVNGTTDAASKAVEIELDEKARSGPSLNDLLSPDQIQMFEREQEDMVKYYNSELQKIRAVESSLAEISSLQTELSMNLEIQSENITQLVQDSVMTTENVGSGNKELKKASERPSTARMVFWSTCSLCTFLVIWDLIF